MLEVVVVYVCVNILRTRAHTTNKGPTPQQQRHKVPPFSTSRATMSPHPGSAHTKILPFGTSRAARVPHRLHSSTKILPFTTRIAATSQREPAPTPNQQTPQYKRPREPTRRTEQLRK